MLKYKTGDICILHAVQYVPHMQYNGTECKIVSVDKRVPTHPYLIECHDGQRMHCQEGYLRYKPGQRRELDKPCTLGDEEVEAMFEELFKEKPDE